MRRRAGLVVAALTLSSPVAAACADTDAPGTVVAQAPAAVTPGSPVGSTARATVPSTGASRPAATSTTASTTAAPIVTSATPATTGVRPTPTVAPTPAPPIPLPSPAPPAAGIAGFDFGTFPHDLGDGVVAPLRGGEFQRGTGPSDPDYLAARLRHVSVGDIDGDGADEAAAEVAWTTGGTGQFADVLVYEWDGAAPVLAARAGSGDRAVDGIRRSFIDDGRLVVERLRGDAACCPDRVVRRAFTLDGAVLRQVGAARTWALVVIDGPDTPIRFLPGTSGAHVVGDVGPERRGSFGARAGQTLTLDVLAAPSGGVAAAEVVADVVQGDAVLGTAEPGVPLTLRLPATGGYAVVGRIVTPGAAVGYLDAELSIA